LNILTGGDFLKDKDVSYSPLKNKVINMEMNRIRCKRKYSAVVNYRTMMTWAALDLAG